MASASRGKSSVPKDVIDQFCGITDVSVEVAERLLEACNGNLEMAIGMHMDDGGSGSQAPTAASSTPTTAACQSAGHQPAAAVDDVRAPIPQRREVLVQDMNTNFGNIDVYRRRRAPRSVFDGLRDFQAEARQQELAAESQVSRSSQKQKTLEDLFRPPIDLMFKGSFHSARDAGTNANRWLMVNVQNAKEFQCQMLNRDVWSNAAVKAIIKDNFMFWQVYNDSEEGRKYMQFYKILQWPYIAILDPRTGENLVTWNNVDAITLCDLVTEFLAEHHLPDGATSPEGPPAKRARKESIVDATEDSQLQAAIQASMQETKAPAPIVIHSDIEYGSDDELETFTDSEDESSSSPVKTPSKNTDSGSSKGKGRADTGGDSDIQLVSESSSSSLSVSSEPSTKTSSNKKTESEPKAGCSSAKSEETNHTAKPTSHSVPSAIGGSSSGGVSGTSGRSAKDSTDCVNGNHGNSNDNSSSSSSSGNHGNAGTNGQTTGGDVPQKKFQFVQQSETAHTMSTWRDHLGDTQDAETTINIRFPDGKRQQFKVPCSTKLRALIMFIQEEGYHKEMYELVTNFPKRRLSYLDIDDTLKNHGLFPQETVFVQER